MVQIEKTLGWNREIIFQNRETKQCYRRIIGGLAWPALPAPGFLVVMAEEILPNRSLNAPRLWVVAEQEAASIKDLHRYCRELRRQCQAEMWLTDTSRKQEVRLFRNYDREFVKNPISLHAAPYSDSSPTMIYIQIIAELTRPERKVLHFGESRLSGYMLSRTPEEGERPAADFPPLAALGYVCAEVVLRQPMNPKTLNQKPITEWNPFTIGQKGEYYNEI